MGWSILKKNKNALMNVDHFWNLPIKLKSSETITLEKIKNLGLKNILEIGSNDRHFKDALPKNCKYHSMDIDTQTHQDFYSIQSIKGKYDAIVMFACIEHITKKDFLEKYLPKIIKSLNLNGYLFISTNNIFHNLGIRTDLTHVQTYSPRDLNSVLMSLGFYSGTCYRISGLNLIFSKIYSFFSKYLLRPYKIDFCPEILLINHKP